METRLSGGENDQGWDDLFIAVEGWSQAVWGGWPVAVVWLNASVLAREERQQTKRYQMMKQRRQTWLHGKEAWHNAVEWRCQPEERHHWGGEMEEMMLVGLTRILLGQKMKKIHTVDSASTDGRWRFKGTMS
jgi:hypothetical protein